MGTPKFHNYVCLLESLAHSSVRGPIHSNDQVLGPRRDARLRPPSRRTAANYSLLLLLLVLLLLLFLVAVLTFISIDIYQYSYLLLLTLSICGRPVAARRRGLAGVCGRGPRGSRRGIHGVSRQEIKGSMVRGSEQKRSLSLPCSRRRRFGKGQMRLALMGFLSVFRQEFFGVLLLTYYLPKGARAYISVDPICPQPRRSWGTSG